MEASKKPRVPTRGYSYQSARKYMLVPNYVETQGTPEEKEGYNQMNLLDFG
jgi:hypothetical protein